MLDSVHIESTEFTPEIKLNKEKGLFEFSGSSLPENAIEFYAPILNWLEKYKETPLDKTEVHLKFDYLNSASSKKLADILFILEEIKENGKEVFIIWHYLDEDDKLQGKGEIFKETVDLPFEFKIMY